MCKSKDRITEPLDILAESKELRDQILNDIEEVK